MPLTACCRWPSLLPSHLLMLCASLPLSAQEQQRADSDDRRFLTDLAATSAAGPCSCHSCKSTEHWDCSLSRARCDPHLQFRTLRSLSAAPLNVVPCLCLGPCTEDEGVLFQLRRGRPLRICASRLPRTRVHCSQATHKKALPAQFKKVKAPKVATGSTPLAAQSASLAAQSAVASA